MDTIKTGIDTMTTIRDIIELIKEGTSGSEGSALALRLFSSWKALSTLIGGGTSSPATNSVMQMLHESFSLVAIIVHLGHGCVGESSPKGGGGGCGCKSGI